MRTPTPVQPPRPLGRIAIEAVMGLAGVLAAVSLLGSCAGSRPSLGTMAPSTTEFTPTTTTTVPGATTQTTLPPSTRELGPDDLLGYIATPKTTPKVYRAPETSASEIPVPAKTEVGAPTTFAVLGDASPTAIQEHPGWYEVALPTRPNNSVGWVQSESVAITKTPLRVFVDLEDRQIRVERDGAEVFTADVAIGTEDNPTPVGGTFVTELIQNNKPKGSYGPFAYGLAMHSNTLTEFAGGDGRVGIHGTDKPKLIGQRVSHGCVRLENSKIEDLVDLQLPLGVPVFIT